MENSSILNTKVGTKVTEISQTGFISLYFLKRYVHSMSKLLTVYCHRISNAETQWSLSVNGATIGSCNDLSPVRHQAIAWANADFLTIRHLGKIVFIQKNALKIGKWRPFCSGGDRLSNITFQKTTWSFHLHQLHFVPDTYKHNNLKQLYTKSH